MEQENRRCCDGLAGIWGAFYRLLSADFTINGQLKPVFIGVIWNFLKKLCRSGKRGGTERFPGVYHMHGAGQKKRHLAVQMTMIFFALPQYNKEVSVQHLINHRILSGAIHIKYFTILLIFRKENAS